MTNYSKDNPYTQYLMLRDMVPRSEPCKAWEDGRAFGEKSREFSEEEKDAMRTIWDMDLTPNQDEWKEREWEAVLSLKKKVLGEEW